MLKIISKIVYKILFYLNKILNFLFKKDFLSWFSVFLTEDSYKSKLIHKNLIKFYCPNPLVVSRVKNLFYDEPETLEWIDSFDKTKKIVFWDIGANIGLYSIYATLKFKNINVVSFEPSFNNLPILSRNIFINNLQNKITICQIPLSEKINKFLKMSEESFLEGSAMNSFGTDKNFEGKKLNFKNQYKIFGTNINYLLDNKILEIPNYIKIDVDGIEDKILKGGNVYLKNKALKEILVEVNENYSKQLFNVNKILVDSGFKMIWKKQVESIVINTKFEKTFNYLYTK
ncbi:FkbM family methyltransferase [Candidatus Pelagibacter sp.]|nr:FkbM family methyltransferase [Candidatus Pelagibacter sp.]|tara:strand:- start:2458 stop:3318 length:861 start_codon:yes stop_codon:yes gene_type:complete